MKLTIILLTAAFLQVSATGHSQAVTYQGMNVKLERVFESIERQTGYAFFYNDADLKKASLVTITLRSVALEAALEQLLKDQPLAFAINGKTIVISSKQNMGATDDPPIEELTPPISVKGHIVNEKGEPVRATITVKGSKNATGTTEDGFFELKNVAENAVLVITGIGIESREVKVNGNTNLADILVKIKATPMDELQVIAYGTTSKRFLVGAVTTIKAADISKQPVNNVFLALQGRVPGLIITPGNGAPGSSVKLQVRGQNTLASSVNAGYTFDQPLIIIDGVPFSPQNQNINLLSSSGGGNAGYISGFGAINNINPNDIESISVLRDADATSIYGSQGANGVILITTKKGVPGKTTFSMRINTGPNKNTRQYKFLNTEQYLQFRREGLANDGVSLPPVFDGQNPDLQLFDSTKNTDWFQTFFGGTSNNTDVNASLTGGTEKMSFIISAGYNKSTYNFPGDFAEKRYSFHAGFHYQSKNDKFGLDFTTDYSYNHNNNSSSPDAVSVNKLPPNTPDLIDNNGNLVWNYKGFDFGYQYTGGTTLTFQHYSYLKQPYNLHKYNLNNSIQLTYKLFAGLSALVNLGYNRFSTSEISQFPLGSQSPNTPYGRYSSATFAKNEYETLNIEPQLTYQRTIGNGVLSLLAGATYKKNINDNQQVTGQEYSNDGFLGSLSGAARISDAYSNNIVYKYIGVYGRIGYIYDNKYILNLTGRRDGSSNFGPGQQYGTFASAGAGWILSEEKFFSPLKPTISLLKLSTNYGTNGSDGVEPYNYQDYWNTPQFLSSNFQGIRPYLPINLYNPEYSWALKKTLNATLDIGLFNDHVLINLNRYYSRTGNQLVGVLLPSQTGFSSVVDNLEATVQNTGWELAITSTNIKNKNFSWTSSFIWSRNRNKLIAFPDLDKSAYSYYYTVGKSLNRINGFRFKGVNPATGLFEFYNRDGHVQSLNMNYDRFEDGGDVVNIADLQPGGNGGVENTFNYKGFSLSVFFQFAKKKDLNYLYSLNTLGYYPGMLGNLPAFALDRWQKPGDITTIQRATSGASDDALYAAGYFGSSDGAYSDASYIRLKTLSIAYDFPAGFLKKAGLQNLRVYANAQNLLTITSYKFTDPEQPGSLSMPLQRTIAFGLLFNF